VVGVSEVFGWVGFTPFAVGAMCHVEGRRQGNGMCRVGRGVWEIVGGARGGRGEGDWGIFRREKQAGSKRTEAT
jgi:hypothetical protein